jgi:GlpG protein
LIGISGVLALWTWLGTNTDVVAYFLIATHVGGPDGAPWEEIAGGQVWRLITPIFLHFGIMHLLFNMLWLKDLGTAIERVMGARTLVALVVVSGLLGNIGQWVWKGPFFGGMSGVVYALFGYVWMKAKFDPVPRFRVDSQMVMWMIGWFLLCALTNLVGPVANMAHGVGLAVGVIWGFISAKSPVRRF